MDIFLLEDDDAIAMGLTYSLEPEGYQVTRASTVKEAMRFMLAQGRPGDILILAGKGHEQYQEIKGDYLPFNERKIAQEILESLGGNT